MNFGWSNKHCSKLNKFWQNNFWCAYCILQFPGLACLNAQFLKIWHINADSRCSNRYSIESCTKQTTSKYPGCIQCLPISIQLKANAAHFLAVLGRNFKHALCFPMCNCTESHLFPCPVSLLHPHQGAAFNLNFGEMQIPAETLMPGNTNSAIISHGYSICYFINHK